MLFKTKKEGKYYDHWKIFEELLSGTLFMTALFKSNFGFENFMLRATRLLINSIAHL